MGVFAFDFPATDLTADFDLDTFTAACGLTWQKLASGPFAASMQVKATNDATGTTHRADAFVTGGSQKLNYLPIASSARTLRAYGRRAVMSTAATARGFLGFGFIDAQGNGYFGGWANDATPQATYAILRTDASAGAVAPLALWGSRTPYVAPNAFSRMCMFEYDRQTAALRFYFDGMQVAAATDATYSPTYPAIFAHDLGLATTTDLLLEAVYAEDGASGAATSAVQWRASGSHDWIGEATVNFATHSTYSISTEALLEAGRVKARTMALSAYEAQAAVTVTIDGTTTTVPAGAELQIAAPASGAFSVAGTSGVLRVRLFTGEYAFNQRN